MAKCNNTLQNMHIHEVDLPIGISFYHLGLILSALAGLIAICTAGWLLLQHAKHYSKPWEQRHIIRILFMLPVYAVVSFLSYYNYLQSIYYQVLRDCYEAFAIASFFSLLCAYLAPNLHDQKEYFRGIRSLRNWVWPLTWIQKCTGGQQSGRLRIPQSGLTWFNIIWIAVFQYCFIRVFFTIVSVISQATDRYCESSLSPAFAHIWVLVFEAASVTVAMYGLIQFYLQTKEDLAEHRPFLKILCIKLVIFFSFWQSLVISFLASSNGPLQPNKYLSYPDISIGIPSMLLCLEMAIFSVLHIFAFPWRKPYGIPDFGVGKPVADNGLSADKYATGPRYPPLPQYQGGYLGWKALLDAFNPWDIVKASARGFRWLFVGARYRHHDRSYQPSRNQDFDTDGISGNDFPLQGQPGIQGRSDQYGFPPPTDTYYEGRKAYSELSEAQDAPQFYPYNAKPTSRPPTYQKGDQAWLRPSQSPHTLRSSNSHGGSPAHGPMELESWRQDELSETGHGRGGESGMTDGAVATYSFDTSSEDRAGLLRHAQSNGRNSPDVHPVYRQGSSR